MRALLTHIHPFPDPSRADSRNSGYSKVNYWTSICCARRLAISAIEGGNADVLIQISKHQLKQFLLLSFAQ